MIRLIQRRLIIPRGDTGTFTVPVLATKNTGDVAVFSIIDTMTDKKVFEKIVNVSGDTMTIEFSHYDTVNLPVGKYVWDIKFYQNPEFMDGVLVNGVEVDSYYAAFTMPICEIRQTGDNLLMADDAPGTELTPDQLDILNAAVNETNAAKNQANESAASANTAATTAADRADEATAKAEEATAKAEEATAALNELKEILPTLAEVATSGSYEDLEDKPFIPSRVSDLTDDSGHYIKPANGIPASDLEETYLTEHQDISGKANIADLATVATSGSYEDLSDKPTIPEVPVQDVQVNGTSILSNGVAILGVGSGLAASGRTITVSPASNTAIKAGSDKFNPIAPQRQHIAAFYGLSKAAGADLANEENITIGTYPAAAKTAIQTMLDVPSNAAMTTAIGNAIGNINSFDMAVVQELPTQDISTHTIYLVPKTGETNDVYDEYVYINNAWEMVGNTQIDLSNYVQKTDYATANEAGVVRVSGSGNGISIDQFGAIKIYPAQSNIVKTADNTNASKYQPITPSKQHESTFYGLAKAAGDTTQSQSDNAVGTYTNEAKAAIQQMLDVPNKAALDTKAPVIYKTVTGSSLTITDAIPNLPLKSLTLTITGDPTDVGTTSASVVVSPSTIAAEGTTYTKSFDAIYEGTLDFIGGKLTVTKAILDLGSIGYNYNNDYHYFFSQALYGIIDTNEPIYSSDLTVITPEEIQAGTDGVAFGGATYIYVYNNNYVGMTIDEFKAAVAGKCIAYSLRTPRVVQLSAEDIRALSGTTYISSDDGNLNVEYLVDTKSYIDAGIENIDLSGFATKADTVLDTTLSRGRRADTIVGEGSFAFGSNIEASGANSFAIGNYAMAKGDASYARGTYAKALGNSSSAEGSYIHAVGTSSHAEGGASTKVIKFTGEANSTIYKISSFIPVGSLIGNTSAPNGVFSAVVKVEQIDDLWYATLDSTLDSENSIADSRRQAYIGSALEPYSHTEGSNSIALGMMQHVEGRNNYVDANYVHIVGNGFTSTQRSNAYALDWDGNGHYAGDVYVHANADSTGGTKLATIGDIPTIPVTDVQVNGVSVLDNGVANVPVGSTSISGVMSIDAGGPFVFGTGNNIAKLRINVPTDDNIKGGNQNRLLPLNKLHQAAFFGLSKAAGADLKDDANIVVGTYPDYAKAAIQSMLGITQMLAPENPNLVASQPYSIGEVFAANGHLYKATAAIAQDAAIIPNTNCVETTMAEAGGKIKDVQVNGTSAVENGVANVPIATNNSVGVVRAYTPEGVSIRSNGQLLIFSSNATKVKNGTEDYQPITPYHQHESTFYGLSKVAGVDLANETVTLGTYPEASKTAIKQMLGVQDGLKVVRLI